MSLLLDERRRAMLREMGLPDWAPLAAAGTAAAAAAERADASDPAPPARGADAILAASPGAPPPNGPQGGGPAPAPADPVGPRARAAGGLDVVAPTAPGAVATMGWDDLRAAVAACRACALCESRTQTVFGVGHTRADWLVVGEAPGEQEDLQGEPFVGESGRLLDRMLAALGLTRAADGEQPPAQRVYIANTLKCRPPRNRNPAPDEMARCEPFLLRQIELLRPRIILALGRFAVQALLRSDAPIGQLRGRVHRYQGLPLVVSYHPAYLLRSPAEKGRAWADLCLAAAVAEGAARAPHPDTGAAAQARRAEPDPEP